MKKEITIREFLESPKYAELHEALQNELNHNNMTFNSGVRIGHTFMRSFTNKINHPHRQKEFIKSDAEKTLLKDMKRKYKSKAFNLVAKREEIIKQLVSYATDERMPDWNLKVIIK